MPAFAPPTKMNQEKSANNCDENSPTGETDLLTILIVLAKYKKLLIAVPIASAIFAAGYSIFLPDIFRADTRVLPPQQAQSGAAALLSQLGSVSGVAGAAAGIKSPTDLYIGILQSRTIADKLIARFDLKKVYELASLEKTRKKLEENTSIIAGKDGLITIAVEEKNKSMAAPLANAYVVELTALTKVLAVTEAAQRRLFYEGQLELAKNKLAAAEIALKSALDTSGVISVDSESRSIVETVARLRAQVSAKEIEIGAMQAFVTTNNPEYKRASEQLNSLKDELSKLENGRARTGMEAPNPVNQSGLENIKILRDVKYSQMLYEILAKQYEAARLDEAKDPSMIQVLDKAVDPERNVRPRRLVITLVAAIVGGFLALLLIFFLETKKKIKNSYGGAEKIAQLKSALRL